MEKHFLCLSSIDFLALNSLHKIILHGKVPLKKCKNR